MKICSDEVLATSPCSEATNARSWLVRNVRNGMTRSDWSAVPLGSAAPRSRAWRPQAGVPAVGATISTATTDRVDLRGTGHRGTGVALQLPAWLRQCG